MSDLRRYSSQCITLVMTLISLLAISHCGSNSVDGCFMPGTQCEAQFSISGQNFGLSPQFTVSGTAESGATVSLYDNASCQGTPLTQISSATFANGASLQANSTQMNIYAVEQVSGEEASVCSRSKATYSVVDWVWAQTPPSGPGTYNFGTQGIASASNYPPKRSAGAAWITNDNTIWLFAGNSNTAPLEYGDRSDLWSFDIAQGTWTWVNGPTGTGNTGSISGLGNFSPSNFPPCRAAGAFWTGANNNLYYFGGYNGVTGGEYADFWEFDTSLKQWAWISGSTTANDPGNYGAPQASSTSYYPSSRFIAATWTTSDGKLWLFGGNDAPGDYYNDLWNFDPGSLNWTWVSGSSSPNQFIVYPPVGQASTTAPGAREAACEWTDSQGLLWLFGGAGYSTTSSAGFLNDVWKYNPSTNLWTLVAGAATLNLSGVPGTQGVVSGAIPGGRRGSACWSDSHGRIWMFGGLGYDSVGTFGQLSDLWYFDPSALQWVWFSGPTLANQVSPTTTLNQFSPSNFPTSRQDVSLVQRSNGLVWFFGGQMATGMLNDVWQIQSPYSP